MRRHEVPDPALAGRFPGLAVRVLLRQHAARTPTSRRARTGPRPATGSHYWNSTATKSLDGWKTTLNPAKQHQSRPRSRQLWLQKLPLIPLFIGPRWSTYSTKYFHCFTSPKDYYGDPIFTTFPDNVVSFTRICPGGSNGASVTPGITQDPPTTGGRAPTPVRRSQSGTAMRWFLRRLGFYVFAIWVAITLNFLLPRLMPGDPLGGMMQRLTPAQIAGEPRHHQHLPGACSAGRTSRCGRRTRTTCGNIFTGDFGISTSNYPTHVSEVIGRTLPYSIFLVGVAFLLAFILGITIGMVAAWRRGGIVDNFVMPGLLALGAFPAFFTVARRGLLPRPEARLVPDPARLRQRASFPGFNWTFLSSALRHAELPMHRDRVRLRRRLGAEHAHDHDQHDRRGLRRRWPRPRACTTGA